MRLIPASCAAALKEEKLRTTPGISSDSVVKGMSPPKRAASTAAAAPLKVLCPDVYSGNGGVTSSGVQPASFSVSTGGSRSPLRIAVTGRQNSNLYLQSQEMIAASASAMFKSA